MTMNRTAVAMGISLAAGFAAAAIVFNANRQTSETLPDSGAAVDPGAYFDQSAATEDRIRALEEAVAQERNARLLLEEELQALYGEIDELGGSDPAAGQAAADAEIIEPPREFRNRRTSDPDARLARLVDSGFSPDRAEWIVRRESELQMQQLEAIFEARQSGEPPDRSLMDTMGTLRQELGDTQYEQYLEAFGEPTSVEVRSVLASSPGQRAGLQPGDEIVAYGGERVFNYSDLNTATMGREMGESVVIDIVRGGVPMQVVVDSGPIGISGRNFGISRRR